MSNLIIARRNADVPIIFTRYVLRADYKILVSKDAVAAIDIGRHKGTLATIEYGFGPVTTSANLINDLLGIAT